MATLRIEGGKRLSGAVAVEGNEARRQTRHDPLAEHLGRRGPLARARAQTLKLALLRAQLRDHGLKSFEHELGLVARPVGLEHRGALGLADQLAVRAQQPAREQQHDGHGHQ